MSTNCCSTIKGLIEKGDLNGLDVLKLKILDENKC